MVAQNSLPFVLILPRHKFREINRQFHHSSLLPTTPLPHPEMKTYVQYYYKSIIFCQKNKTTIRKILSLIFRTHKWYMHKHILKHVLIMPSLIEMLLIRQ